MALHALRRRRGVGWLAVAGLLALLAAVFTARAASDGPVRTEAVIVARVPIPAGAPLDGPEGDLALAVLEIPVGVPLPGLIRDPSELRGRRALAPIAPGEPITRSLAGANPDAGPAPLAQGERAIPVPLSTAGGSAAALAPGIRVDVVASTGEGPSGRSGVVVADAEVLAVGAGSADALADGSSGTALLRVSRSQALRLTAALNFAQEVRLLIRPFGEPPRPVPRPARAPLP